MTLYDKTIVKYILVTLNMYMFILKNKCLESFLEIKKSYSYLY
jgi:hypothetical protein